MRKICFILLSRSSFNAAELKFAVKRLGLYLVPEFSDEELFKLLFSPDDPTLKKRLRSLDIQSALIPDRRYRTAPDRDKLLIEAIQYGYDSSNPKVHQIIQDLIQKYQLKSPGLDRKKELEEIYYLIVNDDDSDYKDILQVFKNTKERDVKLLALHHPKTNTILLAYAAERDPDPKIRQEAQRLLDKKLESQQSSKDIHIIIDTKDLAKIKSALRKDQEIIIDDKYLITGNPQSPWLKNSAKIRKSPELTKELGTPVLVGILN